MTFPPDDEPFTCPHCGNDRFELYFGGTRPARVICTNCGDDIDAVDALPLTQDHQ